MDIDSSPKRIPVNDSRSSGWTKESLQIFHTFRKETEGQPVPMSHYGFMNTYRVHTRLMTLLSSWLSCVLEMFEYDSPATSKSVACFTRPVLPTRVYESKFAANMWYSITCLHQYPLDWP